MPRAPPAVARHSCPKRSDWLYFVMTRTGPTRVLAHTKKTIDLVLVWATYSTSSRKTILVVMQQMAFSHNSSCPDGISRPEQALQSGIP